MCMEWRIIFVCQSLGGCVPVGVESCIDLVHFTFREGHILSLTSPMALRMCAIDSLHFAEFTLLRLILVQLSAIGFH